MYIYKCGFKFMHTILVIVNEFQVHVLCQMRTFIKDISLRVVCHTNI